MRWEIMACAWLYVFIWALWFANRIVEYIMRDASRKVKNGLQIN